MAANPEAERKCNQSAPPDLARSPGFLPHVGGSGFAEHAGSRSPRGDRSARCPSGQHPHPHPPLLGVRSSRFCSGRDREVRSSFCFHRVNCLRSSFRSPPAGSSDWNEPFLSPSPQLPSAYPWGNCIFASPFVITCVCKVLSQCVRQKFF